jgi:hypothetical protein
MFEIRFLRRIFGPNRDEVAGEWRKLHSEELHKLYSSPDIIRQIKSSLMRWAGHVARMGEERILYKVLKGKREGKKPLGRPRRRWEDVIRMDLRETGLGVVDWIRLAQDMDLLAGCCECGDEPSGSCTTELVSDNNATQVSVLGLATVQGISRWRLAAEARVRARVSPCGICGGKTEL